MIRTYAEKNKKQLKEKIRKMLLNEKRFLKVINLKTPDKLVIEPIEQTLDLKSLPEIKGHAGSLIGMNV